MRFFILFMCLIPLQSFAQNKISPQAFQVNVKPVLAGIVNDFYQMVALFPDVPRELIDIIDDLDGLSEQKNGLLKDCPRLLEDKCLSGIDALRSKLRSLDLKTISLIRKQGQSQSLHLTSLSGKRVIDDFQECLESLKAKLDNISFMIKAHVPLRQETSPLIKQVDELNTFTSLALVEYVPYTYKEDFRHFYFSFVYPIQLQMGKSQNHEFMNRNLTSLNFALNLLNMNLTKRNKKTPEGMAPYLATIHNRWNSILRYYY